MIYLKSITFTLTMMLPAIASANDYTIEITKSGVEYGYHQGTPNGPLLIIATTDIKESMTNTYSPIGEILSSKGYSVAAIDVPCHGKDINKKEGSGLNCWRARADENSYNIFDSYIDNLKSVLGDIAEKHKARLEEITVLGISRGGYIAIKASAEIPSITSIIAMAPVTDVFRLREFENSKANKTVYTLAPYYQVLSKKHVFIQINNNDDRVGTAETLSLIAGVTKVGNPYAVDLTAILTPKKGHSTSEHEMAAAWALTQQQKLAKTEDQMSAPK
ncbi:serine aminopeptidase domain-containing protein [Pseudomonas sp. NFACC45]|uniref:serine aminopeptidase domain-containing protein n=1 Tax=Pseudomonas sp. NFACC45 TaxID=1566201 RepID=UPI0008E8D0A3|nr:alpha/beta hydrolase [Pseudomonas sp. NFACC45]SFH44112.1 Serine aminopeptidase, S33 [Pseudomonas sp. NFACC45]